MRDDFKEILFTEEEILAKVKEMAAKISEDYKDGNLVVVGVLKGSVVFTSDLLKYITVPCVLDFMAVSSYGLSSESSGIVKIIKDLDYDIEGKDLLIVEDIVDTGTTLKYLLEYLKARKAKSVAIASLLSKPARRKTEIDIKYLGFSVPDEFIVGYGIDYAEGYRNTPYIGILKEEIYK
ncbi:MAG: hypoxanthine phosphoribosyltransferase [Clostridiaceae bacterium]